jgi:hypothetical protein
LMPCAALIGQTLLHQPKRAERRWLLLVLVLPIASLLPETFQLQTTLQRPYTYAAMQRWFEENMPDGSIIWTSEVDPYNSLSRYDRGYSGYKNFDAILGVSAENTRTMAEADYLYVTEHALANYTHLAYPLVKFIGGEPYREPDLYVYLAKPLPQPQTTLFQNSTSSLILHGLEAQRSKTHVTTESYWSAPHPPDRIYSYLLYVSPRHDPGVVLAQVDGQLGQRPTHTWADPNELLRGEMAALQLPELTPGEYTAWLILYSWETGERFKLADQREALTVLEWVAG